MEGGAVRRNSCGPRLVVLCGVQRDVIHVLRRILVWEFLDGALGTESGFRGRDCGSTDW